ncbi:hypothetical protein [Castellaniella sp.]|uniref:hypothetical protein n=1 Tax=Castellaniella sp. TaxID=1955812 RepID=UPI003C769273
MTTVNAWIDARTDLGYSMLYAQISDIDGQRLYTISSGHGPLDRAVMVAQGDFRQILDADVARTLGRQLIAAADHYEAQQRGAQS